MDAEGVAHVYASDDVALFFADGYQQATDRLYPMEVGRLAALGRLAELHGADHLESDRQAHTFGFARWGAASADAMSRARPDDHALVVAFTDGINQRLHDVQQGVAPAPPELEALGHAPAPWTPADVMAIGTRIQFGYSNTLAFDVLTTLVDRLAQPGLEDLVFRPHGAAFIMGPPPAAGRAAGAGNAPRVEISAAEARRLGRALGALRDLHGLGEGSNSWLVHGRHSENGRPWLANDSHGPLRDPNVMHLVHLSSAHAGGAFDVVGWAFPGVPGVQIGHNRYIAWGATTAFADVMDLFDVDIDEAGALLGTERVPVERRTETLRSRRADGGFDEETFEVREVPGHGVVVPDALLPVPAALFAGGQLLLAYPGFEATTELFGFFDLDRADSLEAFDLAIDEQRIGMQNWSAASALGIRYRTSGRVPDRGPAPRPRANRVLDGTDARSLWTGSFLPRERLPRRDGSEDFVVTANNDPWGHTADGDPTNDAFYYGSFFAPGFRAARLEREVEALVERGSVARGDHEALQYDVASPLAASLVPRVVAAVARRGSVPALADLAARVDLDGAAAELGSWDLRATREAHEAATFRVFLAFLSRRALGDALGLLFDPLDDAQPVTLAKMTVLAYETASPVLGDADRADEHVVRALADALDELRARAAALGVERVTWGDLHRAVFRTPALDGELLLATPGDDSTINVAQSRCWDGGRIAEYCRTTGGAVYRLVVGFAQDGTPEATYSWPRGEAPTDDWLQGRTRRLPFRRSDVEASGVETRYLTRKRE